MCERCNCTVQVKNLSEREKHRRRCGSCLKVDDMPLIESPINQGKLTLCSDIIIFVARTVLSANLGFLPPDTMATKLVLYSISATTRLPTCNFIALAQVFKLRIFFPVVKFQICLLGYFSSCKIWGYLVLSVVCFLSDGFQVEHSETILQVTAIGNFRCNKQSNTSRIEKYPGNI